MAETTDAISRPLNHLNLSINWLLNAEACQTLPLELWYIVYQFLQLDAEAQILESTGFQAVPQAYGALRSLGHTCRSLYRLYLSIASRVVYISPRPLGVGIRGRRESGNAVKTAWLEGRDMEVSAGLRAVPGIHRLVLSQIHFTGRNALHWVTVIPTVKSLKLQRCKLRDQDFSFPPSLTTPELYSMVDLRKSNVKSLDLDNSYQDAVQLPRALALL
ncbi:hypothetical protein FRC01_000920, partial [Tulasnella sp. 417]